MRAGVLELAACASHGVVVVCHTATFTTFISYVKAHNWAAAANDARGTLCCSQVGSRCTRDTSIIEAGCDMEMAPTNLRGALDSAPMMTLEPSH